jgi:uncharacterized protein
MAMLASLRLGIVPSVLRALMLAAVAAMALSGPAARAASFACDKAKSTVERTVCAEAELSALDEHLGRYYAAAHIELAHAESCMVADQRQWLRAVRDACKDAACLKGAYLDRLAELNALQPGVTAIRHIELPVRPALSWIVPPAADEVAAPRNSATKPLVARGQLVDEIASGDGVVLRTAGGAKHLVMLTMLLQEPSAGALAQLARIPNARYEVRGERLAQPGAGLHFAASRCTFVHRVAP